MKWFRRKKRTSTHEMLAVAINELSRANARLGAALEHVEPSCPPGGNGGAGNTLLMPDGSSLPTPSWRKAIGW